jgi:hypothetical protein
VPDAGDGGDQPAGAEGAVERRVLGAQIADTADGIIVDLRTAGLGTLVRDLLAPRSLENVA